MGVYFPVGKEFDCSVGDPGLIRGSGRTPAEGNGQPTPVFLPGEVRGLRNLVGYSPRGLKESERLRLASLRLTLSQC